jgi:hypothetical protein
MKTTLLFMLLALRGLICAQESFNASGGVNCGVGGTVSFSVGQLVYTTESGRSGNITQGIQRPYRVSLVENKPQIKLVFESVAYPNPTTDDLFLHINVNEKLVYQLVDLNGKAIADGKLTYPISYIPMQSVSAGMYLLQIFDSNPNPVQTLQIIKD